MDCPSRLVAKWFTPSRARFCRSRLQSLLQDDVKLDPKAKPEKSIDFHIDEAPDDAKGKDSKGIYQLEGADTLTLCFSGEGDRPTKFEQIGFEQILTKLKRKKTTEKKTEGK